MDFERMRGAGVGSEQNKRKSSVCCGLSGVCRESIVTQWAVHSHRTSWSSLYCVEGNLALNTRSDYSTRRERSDILLADGWCWRTRIVLQVHTDLPYCFSVLLRDCRVSYWVQKKSDLQPPPWNSMALIPENWLTMPGHSLAAASYHYGVNLRRTFAGQLCMVETSCGDIVFCQVSLSLAVSGRDVWMGPVLSFNAGTYFSTAVAFCTQRHANFG